MKLETFFEKFDELSDTPNGVKQLRELVLQLAVEGGLVPHSAAEPAVPYASLEDAAPINVSDVPENWRVVLLADAIKNRSGNSKLIKGKLHDEPAAGRFQGFSASGADVWCDDYEHEGAAIIISAVGARCGKAFKASGKWSAIANTNITRPQPSLFDFDFAYLVLNNEHFWVRGGSAQPFVKFPPSLDRHFALPPLAEQKRIVAKVDELMALCDRLEAQQQERETRHAALARASLARFALNPQPSTLNFLFHPSYAIPPADLRKSILTLAVQGKLIPNDPDGKPVGMKLSGGLHGGSSLAPNWRAGLLGDAFNFEYGDNLPGPKRSQSGEYPVYGSNGIVGTHNTYLTKEPAIIVGRKGSAGALNIADGPSWTTDVAYFVRPPRDIDLRFTYYLFSTLRLDDLGKGIKPGLSRKDAYALSIALPPLAEQRRIVAKVEQLMALVDELETQLAASRATAANLLSAFVAELTGSPHNGKLSFPAASTTGSRGRPRKA